MAYCEADLHLCFSLCRFWFSHDTAHVVLLHFHQTEYCNSIQISLHHTNVRNFDWAKVDMIASSISCASYIFCHTVANLNTGSTKTVVSSKVSTIYTPSQNSPCPEYLLKIANKEELI